MDPAVGRALLLYELKRRRDRDGANGRARIEPTGKLMELPRPAAQDWTCVVRR